VVSVVRLTVRSKPLGTVVQLGRMTLVSIWELVWLPALPSLSDLLTLVFPKGLNGTTAYSVGSTTLDILPIITPFTATMLHLMEVVLVEIDVKDTAISF